MRARKVQDRGKFRQLAAQIAMLYFTRRSRNVFCDINAPAIDDFYYENLGFDSNSSDARRLCTVLDNVTQLLSDQKRPKIIGHEAIHLVLFIDSMLDDYTRSWETDFASAFDRFREEFAKSKQTRNDANPSQYWLRYGILTRVNSDRGESIQRRHDFFTTQMREFLKPQLKDSDDKKCAVCSAEVIWDDGA
jgi:hypothetical protein